MRKNEILPIHLDAFQLDEIFRRIRERPKEDESVRVEKILECLSVLRSDSPTREKMQVVARLRRLIKHYAWERRVIPQGNVFRVVTLFSRDGEDQLSREEVWERQSVGSLLDTVPYLGNPPRIRRCAECAAWFFAAKRITQEYCSGNCRQHHYDNDPARKAAKAAEMRRLRAEAKRRQNPKSAVGLGRTRRAVKAILPAKRATKTHTPRGSP
jgi:hypothetical protein